MRIIATLGKSESKHAYDVETDKGMVLVYASNRDHAARIAEREGYEVRSVNMIG